MSKGASYICNICGREREETFGLRFQSDGTLFYDRPEAQERHACVECILLLRRTVPPPSLYPPGTVIPEIEPLASQWESIGERYGTDEEGADMTLPSHSKIAITINAAGVVLVNLDYGRNLSDIENTARLHSTLKEEIERFREAVNRKIGDSPPESVESYRIVKRFRTMGGQLVEQVVEKGLEKEIAKKGVESKYFVEGKQGVSYHIEKEL